MHILWTILLDVCVVKTPVVISAFPWKWASYEINIEVAALAGSVFSVSVMNNRSSHPWYFWPMSIISNLFLRRNEFSCSANQCRASIHTGSPHLLCVSPGLLIVDYWTLEAILLLFVEKYIWRKQAAYWGICFLSTNVALCGENLLAKIIHRNPIGCLGRQLTFTKVDLFQKVWGYSLEFGPWSSIKNEMVCGNQSCI